MGIQAVIQTVAGKICSQQCTQLLPAEPLVYKYYYNFIKVLIFIVRAQNTGQLIFKIQQKQEIGLLIIDLAEHHGYATPLAVIQSFYHFYFVGGRGMDVNALGISCTLSGDKSPYTHDSDCKYC